MAPLGPTAPSLESNEEAEFEQAMMHLRRRQWGEARKAFHALAASNTVDKRYRALLSYARGREAQDAGRHDVARAEFTRAVQLDPELNAARTALAEVAPPPSEPPEPAGKGLFSRLLKK